MNFVLLRGGTLTLTPPPSPPPNSSLCNPLSQNLQLKHTLVAGARAYLQPLDCIQTKRTVSCVRWNPSDEEQVLCVCRLSEKGRSRLFAGASP